MADANTPSSQPTAQDPPPKSCYRHPDRSTRLSCTRCGRPICTECTTHAHVGLRCPDHAASEAKVISGSAVMRGGLQQQAPVTFWLLVVNVAVFVLTQVTPQLFNLGAQVNPLVAAGEWWRLLTATFLHAGLLHLAFNMYALYILGPALERRFSSAAFAALYLASAIAGGAAFYVGDLVATPLNSTAVGASGAVFGIFGGALLLAYHARDSAVGSVAFRQLGILLAINLALPLFAPGIAWQAHLGGLAVGAGLVAMWLARNRDGSRGQRVGAALAITVALLAAVTVL